MISFWHRNSTQCKLMLLVKRFACLVSFLWICHPNMEISSFWVMCLLVKSFLFVENAQHFGWFFFFNLDRRCLLHCLWLWKFTCGIRNCNFQIKVIHTFDTFDIFFSLLPMDGNPENEQIEEIEALEMIFGVCCWFHFCWFWEISEKKKLDGFCVFGSNFK